MAWWWWLILGAFVGWLIEWVIDWIYWRRRLRELREAQAKLEAENETMHGERDQNALNLRTLRADNERVQASLDAIRGEYDQSQEHVTTLQAENERAKGESAKLRAENDRLSHDLAAALAEARTLGSLRDERNQLQASLATGATERDQLRAELTALQHQVNSHTGERQQLEHDLATLRNTADEREQETTSLRARLAELMAAGAARAESGIGKIIDSGKALFAGAATIEEPPEETPGLGFSHGGEVVADEVAPETEAPESATIPHFSATLSGDEPQTTLAAATDDTAIYHDPLADIDGIGPIYEQRLFAAGITTFNQLAALSADQLRQIVEPSRWQDVELSAGEAWIAEARQRATTQPLYVQSARDPLIDIDGIGPVYEQKLFTAGVTTFAQLAQMTPDEVQAIIKPEAWQHVDFAGWIAEASAFAARRDSERNG